jgi:hypothetical protein
VGSGVDIRPLADDCAAALGRLGVA